ncbi:MAG: alpha/beta hydrolase [Hyphomicrobiales bacterium]|nr:alpha/beta hydrolase [Hyphomicrobiales bacterium]
MLILLTVVVLAALAAVTWAGTIAIERDNPPAGRFVDVDGGRLHIVEMGAPDAPPVVLLHGASGNLRDMQLALGDRLAARYRVILIDRPGHGWSDRPNGRGDASPAAQATLIHQALVSLGVTRPILLGHSWSGALATAYALAYPDAVRGLILLAPVTHPWPGGIGWINDVVALPVVGPLIARTLILPSGYFMLKPGVANVFRPDTPPPDYGARTGVAMLLRPNEFIANAQDLSGLKDFVSAQSPRYGELKMPLRIISGDKDPVVYTDIHSRAIARQVPQARLTVLPGVGHMVQYVAADDVARAIDDMAAR